MTSRITFISHAPTSAVRVAAFPLDEPLEATELLKLQSHPWQVPRAQAILSAPEQRTRMTSRALALEAQTNLPLQTDQALRDCNYGTWSGRNLTDIEQEDPTGLMQWLTDPNATPHNGESITHLINRTAQWLQTRTDKGHTIAITHPSIIRAAILITLSAPTESFWRIEIAPFTLTDLRHNTRTWILRAASVTLASYE